MIRLIHDASQNDEKGTKICELASCWQGQVLVDPFAMAFASSGGSSSGGGKSKEPQLQTPKQPAPTCEKTRSLVVGIGEALLVGDNGEGNGHPQEKGKKVRFRGIHGAIEPRHSAKATPTMSFFELQAWN